MVRSWRADKREQEFEINGEKFYFHGIDTEDNEQIILHALRNCPEGMSDYEFAMKSKKYLIAYSMARAPTDLDPFFMVVGDGKKLTWEDATIDQRIEMLKHLDPKVKVGETAGIFAKLSEIANKVCFLSSEEKKSSLKDSSDTSKQANSTESPNTTRGLPVISGSNRQVLCPKKEVTSTSP